jgi:protein-tyrosine phosphatase
MGNICRSPTAEAVFAAQVRNVAPGLAIEIDSAGTHDYHVGDPPDTRSQQVALAHGVDMSTLRARVLTVQDFARFDHVLAMDRQNLQAIQRLAPKGSTARVQLLLDYAPQQRLREVPDPYYGGLADFELVFELTREASVGLLQSLLEQVKLRTTGPT